MTRKKKKRGEPTPEKMNWLYSDSAFIIAVIAIDIALRLTKLHSEYAYLVAANLMVLQFYAGLIWLAWKWVAIKGNKWECAVVILAPLATKIIMPLI